MIPKSGYRFSVKIMLKPNGLERENAEGVMPSLAGKVALVTGSSQGIGAALAMALAAEGAKVVVSDVQDCADTVRQIAEQGGEAIGVPADVTDNQSLKELVATAETALGPVGVLVNNAGIFGTLQLKPLMQISEDEWDAVFRVNARGVFQATKAVIPSMQRAGGGSIIHISSGTRCCAARRCSWTMWAQRARSSP
jgi:NAD(P)-dependent dehydrogenase (short-subunit alcohol dehydrogenase family)